MVNSQPQTRLAGKEHYTLTHSQRVCILLLKNSKETLNFDNVDLFRYIQLRNFFETKTKEEFLQKETNGLKYLLRLINVHL